MPQFNIANLFTPKVIDQAIATLPELHSTIMDTVFTDRANHPFPTIGIDEVTKTTRNIPVVKRGSPSYPLKGSDRSISFIEPQPVNPSRFVSASELNNLRLLDDLGTQQFVADVLDDFRRTVRATTEALAAQSIFGKIDYPAAIEGGATVDYQVDFGSIKELAIAAGQKWTLGKATIADIVSHLVAMTRKIKESGYGGSIVFLAGAEVFIELVKLVLDLKDSASSTARITDIGVQFAGFTVQHVSDTYTNNRDGSTVDVIDPKTVIGISTAAPHRLRYLAIDDVSANLQAVPLFTRVIEKQDPSGYNIIGHSKPLPMPVVSAICKAVVL